MDSGGGGGNRLVVAVWVMWSISISSGSIEWHRNAFNAPACLKPVERQKARGEIKTTACVRNAFI